MNHGFNGTKDFLLQDYALEFNKIGYTVLTYDYRTYGESEGSPRQLYSTNSQLDDIRGAISFIREKVGINNIILWGTSAGAPHGLVIAAEDKNIKGVICQCGSYNHKLDQKKGMKENGFLFYISLLPHGIRDKWRTKLGLSNHIVPAYGRSNTKVFLRSDTMFYSCEQLGLKSKNFINEVSAYFMLQPHGPNLLEVAKGINCKVLLLVCEYDEIISSKSYEKIKEILSDSATIIKYPIGHFDIYSGEWLNKAIEDQKSFILKL